MITVQGHSGAVCPRGSFLFFAALSLVHTGVLIYFSLFHAVPTIPGDSNTWSLRVDKQLLMHIAVYAVLFGLLHATFSRAPRRSLRAMSVFLALALACALGLVLELGQLAVPTRAFEWGDLLANVLGVALAVLLDHTNAGHLILRLFRSAGTQR